jgi:hypothetical protein
MAKNSRNRKVGHRRRRIPDDFLIRDDKEVERLFRKAVAKALRVHRALNNPVAVMQKGRVVLVKA